jgi:hypothetical protein
MPSQTDLLPGTLDALILKAVSLQRHHGYGVMERIQQITGGAFTPRCTASSTRVTWLVSGVYPTTTVAPSTTSSR